MSSPPTSIMSPKMLKETSNPNSLVTEIDDGAEWSLGLLEWSNIIKFLTLEEFYKCALLGHYIGDNILFYSYVFVLPLWESANSTWPISISRCNRVATRFPFLQQIVCRCGAVSNCDTALTRIATYLLPELKHLRLLDLRGCSITEDGAAVLSEELQLCPSLRELRVGSNGIGSAGAQAIALSIENQWRRLGHGDISDAFNPSTKASDSINQKKSTSSSSTTSTASTASTASVSLTHPRLRFDSSEEDVVHTLDVSANDIGDVGVNKLSHLLEIGVPLRGLDVWGNGITAKALVHLCNTVVEHGSYCLRSLDIGRNQMSGAALAAIVSVLKSDVKLEHVGIEQTFHGASYAHRTTSGDGGGRQLSIAAVINAVGDCPTLTSLDFTGHGIFADEIPNLIQSLLGTNHQNTTLSNMNVNQMNMKQIKNAFNPRRKSILSTSCCNISDLFLGSNRIGDRGAVLLAEAIEKGLGHSLHALGLSGNEISGTGALALIHVFMKPIYTKKWKLLDLSHNQITNEVMIESSKLAENLGELLDRDKVYRRLDLSRNPCVKNIQHIQNDRKMNRNESNGSHRSAGSNGGGGGGGGSKSDSRNDDDDDDDDDDEWEGNVIPNLWSFSNWFGPPTNLNNSTAKSKTDTTTSSQSGSHWVRILFKLRSVKIVSTIESAPGSSKLHGLSLHTWQGKLRKQMSNFKGLEN